VIGPRRAEAEVEAELKRSRRADVGYGDRGGGVIGDTRGWPGAEVEVEAEAEPEADMMRLMIEEEEERKKIRASSKQTFYNAC